MVFTMVGWSFFGMQRNNTAILNDLTQRHWYHRIFWWSSVDYPWAMLVNLQFLVFKSHLGYRLYTRKAACKTKNINQPSFICFSFLLTLGYKKNTPSDSTPKKLAMMANIQGTWWKTLRNMCWPTSLEDMFHIRPQKFDPLHLFLLVLGCLIPDMRKTSHVAGEKTHDPKHRSPNHCPSPLDWTIIRLTITWLNHYFIKLLLDRSITLRSCCISQVSQLNFLKWYLSPVLFCSLLFVARP